MEPHQRLEWLPRQRSAGDRDYFIHHRTHADKLAYLGPPIVSRSPGQWVVTISRRVNDARGQFAGVVLAAIPVRYFQRYYERFSIGTKGRVMLALANGTGITGSGGPNVSGTDIRHTQIFQHLAATHARAGTVMRVSSIDQIERQYSYRRLASYPVIVGAAFEKDKILAEWWLATRQECMIVTVLILALYAVGFWLIAEFKARDRLVAALLDTRNALQARNLELDRQARTDALTACTTAVTSTRWPSAGCSIAAILKTSSRSAQALPAPGPDSCRQRGNSSSPPTQDSMPRRKPDAIACVPAQRPTGPTRPTLAYPPRTWHPPLKQFLTEKAEIASPGDRAPGQRPLRWTFLTVLLMGRPSRLFLAGILGMAAICSATAQDFPGRPGGAVPKGGPTIRDLGLVPNHLDVKYATASRTQVLDVYLPAATSGPVPAVIYAHPGGFRFGDKAMASASISRAILGHGFAFVPVNYRLSGEARFPAAVQDLFAAIEYVKANGAALGIDPKRIVVYGESAGANLAALAGTAYDVPLFRQTLADRAADLRPQGVIAWYPPVDFLQIDSMLVAQGCDAKTATHSGKGGMESAYLGAALTDVPDLVRQANPVTYASARSSPFLLENGTRDCNVGNGQAKLLADALGKAGAKVDYRVVEGAGHGGEQFETADNIARLIHFLDGVVPPAHR